MTAPLEVVVEIAFTTGPDSPSPSWVDVSDYVDLTRGIHITRGRTDQLSKVAPASCTLTLDNSDGRFTAGRVPSVLRTNYAKNPGGTTTSGWNTNAGTGGVVSRTTVASGGPLADCPTFYRNTFTTAPTAGNPYMYEGIVTVGNAYQQPVVATVDQRQASIYVRTSVAGQSWRVGVYWYNSSGSGLGAVAGTTTPVNADEWTLLTCPLGTAPANAVSCLVLTQQMAGPLPGVGDTYDASAVLLLDGTTDLVDFFDGDSEFCVWDGTIEQSTSDQYEPNYYPNVKLGRRLRVSLTDGTTTWRRYDGRVAAWPTQWAPLGLYATATITAYDRMSPLGLVELSNVVACEVLSDGAIDYYMLGDPAGSDTVVNSAESLSPIPGQVVGSVTFGTATGPGTDGITAATFAAGESIQCPVDLAAGAFFTIECWFLTTLEASGSDVPFVYLADDSGGIAYLGMAGLSSDQITGLVDPAGVAGAAQAGGGSTVNDGATHHAALVYDGHANVYLDGTLIQRSTLTAAGLDHISRLYAGTYGQMDPFVGTLAHVALYDTALTASQIGQHRLAGVTGFSGEATGLRVARLARYAGIDTSEVSVTSTFGHVTALDSAGKKALDLMHDTEDAEPGTLFVSATNVLTFQGRRQRWNIGVTAGFAAGTYDAPEPLMDDFGLINDATVGRGEGFASFRSVDQASVNDNGRYPESLDLIVNSDAQTQDRANWEVSVNSEPKVRWPKVAIDVMTQPSVRAGVFALDVGKRLQLQGLPASASASTVDLIVEGYDEDLSTDEQTVTFNCSDYSPVDILLLDNASLGVLDSDNHLGL